MARTSYPTPVRTSSGCKVGWYTYSTLPEAEAASEIAVATAVRMIVDSGYDFGYSSPGDIRENADGTFTVTVP